MNQWNRTAKIFHWTVALLFVAAAAVGFMAESQAMSPAKLQLFVTHKSLGITVLGLMLMRLLWRLLSAAPAALDGLSANNQRFAALGHAGLYALLIALPLSGWLLTSAANFPFRWFGWFKMPMLWPADKAMQDLAGFAHWALFLIVALLVVGHAGMAFWHARKGLPVLRRMFPARPAPAWFLLILLVAAGVVAAVAVARVQSIQAPAGIAGQANSPRLDSSPKMQAEAGQEYAGLSKDEVREPLDQQLLSTKQDVSSQGEAIDPERTMQLDAIQHIDTMQPPAAVKSDPSGRSVQITVPAPVESKTVSTKVAVPKPAVAKQAVVEKPQAAVPQAPTPPSWTMLPANSSLGFIGSYTGAEFTGHFARFEPAIIFDPDKLSGARIEVVVDVTSATLGSADMDAMLPEPEWFNFTLYPKAVFKASQFSKQGDGFVARGELTLKGRSQPVTLKLDWHAQSANRARLRVDTTLNRVAFDIGSGEWAQDSSIGFDVRVQADLALQIEQAR